MFSTRLELSGLRLLKAELLGKRMQDIATKRSAPKL
jgi:hypothetical protein